MSKNLRSGAKGALLDEYQRALNELKKLIDDISDASLSEIVDATTSDADCMSIQTILSHVVHSGYGYATSIHNLKGIEMLRPEKSLHATSRIYQDELTKMFAFTEQVFQLFENNELEELEDSKKIKTRWGQLYDIEQLMEHAIVHILRHRRQIEKFKDKLATGQS